jgi:uncharacterized protein (TIGR03437 family)
VVYQGQYSEPFTVTVAPSAPGIFSVDGSGAGQGLIFNQDGTLNSLSNPAAPGSAIVFYATGVGQFSPAGQDGLVVGGAPLPQPVLPVSAQIGGQPAPVLYAGGASGIAEGLIQVNVQIPTGTSAGPAIPLVLQVGNGASQTNLNVSVQGTTAITSPQASSNSPANTPWH